MQIRILLMLIVVFSLLGIFTKSNFFGQSSVLSQKSIIEAASAPITHIPDIEIEVHPEEPRIFDLVTFSIKNSSEYKRMNFVWDFGDESPEETGAAVTHRFSKPSGEFPYRVKVSLVTEAGAHLVLKDYAIKIENGQLHGACPPNSVNSIVYANSILLESSVISGCFSGAVPISIITQQVESFDSKIRIEVAYSWEKVPHGADLQAILFLKLVTEAHVPDLSTIIDYVGPIFLGPFELGSYSQSIEVNKPEGTRIVADLVLNVLSNPNGERIALEIGRIKVKSFED